MYAALHGRHRGVHPSFVCELGVNSEAGFTSPHAVQRLVLDIRQRRQALRRQRGPRHVQDRVPKHNLHYCVHLFVHLLVVLVFVVVHACGLFGAAHALTPCFIDHCAHPPKAAPR